MRFTNAYTTAPQTLPAHASMLTGLYPAGHGVRENARRLGDQHVSLAERLAALGYDTAAFVSGYPLARPFGLGRGFAVYDDAFGAGRNERSAAATTARALAHLAARPPAAPIFLWVHYYDPHDPYLPPESFRQRYAADPYLGEIAAMDAELGFLVKAFEASSTGSRVLVVGDHGEGRGDHGEMLHGSLLYQGVMRVPLIVAGSAGSGIEPGVRTHAVSVRQVFDTFLGWAGAPAPASLLSPSPSTEGAPPVLGEAMQPFLQYRWQPQTMAVAGSTKVIRSGRFEVFDVEKDSGEEKDLGEASLHDRPFGRELAREIAAYPVPRRSPLRLVPMARVPARSTRKPGAACRAWAISPVHRPPFRASPPCPPLRHGPPT